MARPDGFPDDIYDFEGLFEPGSEADHAIREKAREIEEDKATLSAVMQITVGNDYANAGVTPADFIGRIWTRPRLAGENPINSLFDQDFRVTLDKRARCCRAVFAARGIELSPAIIDEALVSASLDSNLWFAAKFLGHLDRARELEEAGQTTGIGFLRELVLMGETWAQASFTNRLGDTVVSRKLSDDALPRAREKRAENQGTDAGIEWHDEARQVAQRYRADYPRFARNQEKVAKHVLTELKKESPEFSRSIKQIKRIIGR